MRILLTFAIGLSFLVSANVIHAQVAYNITGYDSTGTGGQDGAQPANWIGGLAPDNYSGSMDIMWYMEFDSADKSLTASATDAVIKGAESDYKLAIGPRGWRFNAATPELGRYHGMDFGLIHLEEAANLSITVNSLTSGLIPGLSFYSGWDSGSTWDRLANYNNSATSPFGTSGLNFLGNVAGTESGGSITYSAGFLAAGDYTLFIGGVTGTSVTAGEYNAHLVVSPVPEPEMAGMLLLGLLTIMLRINRSRRFTTTIHNP